jgi:hypothetical protein
MKINFYPLLFLFLLPLAGFAQDDKSAGDFRTQRAGSWTDPGIWQVDAGNGWQTATSYPTAASGKITIRDAVSLVAGSEVVTDETTLTQNGSLLIEDGATLRVVGTGNQLIFPRSGTAGGRVDVYGILAKGEAASFQNSSVAKLVIHDGGTYRHDHTTNGNVPTAAWNAGSTLLIAGLSGNAVLPTGLDQTFHHVIWNTPNLEGYMDMEGRLRTVNGNLDFVHTGAEFVSLGDENPFVINVAGNLYVRENAVLYFSYVQDNARLNVGGTLEISGTNPSTFTSNADLLLTIGQDFLVNGTANHILTEDTGGVTFTVAGNVAWESGGLEAQGDGTSFLYFSGSNPQLYTKAESFSQTAPLNFIIGSQQGVFADVDLGTSALSGPGSLTVIDNSSLRLGSTDPAGALQEGSTGGNIQLSGDRNWGSNATLYYTGSSAQLIGNGFPNESAVNLVIDNPTTVALNNDITIGAANQLSLLDGRLQLAAHTLTLNGDVEVGDGYLESSIASSLVIGGTGNLGPLPFYNGSPVLGSLLLNRNSTNGGLTLGSDLTIASSLVLEAGQLILNGFALTLQGDINSTAGSLISSSESELYVEGSGDATLPFSTATAANFLRILSVDRASGIVDLQNTVIVGDTLFLLSGQLNNLGTIEMATNSAIYRSGGSLAEAPRAVSQYDVIYGAALTTGDELPASANGLRNLIVDATGLVQLDRAVTINGDLQLLDGALSPEEFDITLYNNLLVNAPLLEGSNTFTFEGSSQVSGSDTPAFHHLVIGANASVEMVDIESLSVSGNWINTGGQYVGNTSILTFGGQSDQLILSRAQPFGHVILEGAGIKTLDDNALIDGDLTITESATLDLAGNQLNLTGNWINQGGDFLYGEVDQSRGSVLLTGAAQSILSADMPFGNLLLNGSGNKLLLDELYVAGDLTINSGLDVNAAETDGIGNAIYLGGNWENNGIFEGGQSTVTLNGAETQLLGGSTVTDFNNLDIKNEASPGARAISNQNLLGYLQLSPGVTFVPDGGNGSVDFTLVSSGDRTTASIAALPEGALVDGQVVVQRYMTSHGYIFRYIATPVLGATVNDWADDMTINLASSQIPTMYIYREEVPGLVDEGWEAYPNALSEPLEVGKGYSVEIWENFSQPVVADIKGRVQQGSIDMPVSFTDSEEGDNIDDDGWNLVGNPYPSPIDWISIYANNETTNIDPVVWIADNRSGALQYVSYSAEAGVGLGGDATPYIASGQAFWVKAYDTNPRLTLHEQNKASVAEDAQFYRKKQPEDVLVVGLSRGSVRDETALIFREGATNAYDKGLDTYKLKNEDFSLSSLGENYEDLAYNFMPWFSCSAEVPLYIDYPKEGTYTFDFKYLETFTRAVSFTLVDHLTGETLAVSPEARYTFSITKEPKSHSWDRFKLQVAHEALQLNQAVSAQAVCAGSNAVVLIEGAQQDVQYQAFQDGEPLSELQKGTGGSLELQIPAAKLKVGEHLITIRASRTSCEPMSLIQSASLLVAEPLAVSKVSGGSSCGEGEVTLTAEGAPEGGLYRWYDSQEAESPLSETASSSFTTPTLTQSSWFWVSIINEAGCEGSRMKVYAEVSTLEAPKITEAAGLLQASGSGSYQWYLDGEALEGATGAQLEASQSGTYTVALSKGACTVMSDAFVYEALGLDDLEGLGIALWPNPAADALHLRFPENQIPHTIRIFGTDGKLLLEKRTNLNAAGVYTLDVASLKSGLYLLELQNDATRVRARIIKR